MSRKTRRCLLLAILLGTASLAAGCDLATLAYFLMPEDKAPATMKHLGSSDNEKKAPRVAILSYSVLDPRAELIDADREICLRLGKELEELAKINGEKLEIVSARKVADIKNSCPNWKTFDLATIGRKLQADYVVFIEVHSMSLYEKGSANELFRGRVHLTLELQDVNKPDDVPMSEVMNLSYPPENRAIAAGLDMSPSMFRQKFLGYVGKRLSWYFSKRPPRSHYID